MDPVRNPYTPNAGSVPPELVGRAPILDQFTVTLRRVMQGRDDKGVIITGLRGVGKTVLLVKMMEIAVDEGAVVVHHEVSKVGGAFSQYFPTLARQALLTISPTARWGDRAKRAASILTRFKAQFDPSGPWSFGIELEPVEGIADSGRILQDLPEMVVALGEAARDASRCVVFLLDEIQYLSSDELSALVVAKHLVNQRKLPVVFAGAGLPALPVLTSGAQTYAERMFMWPDVGPLNDEESSQALAVPAYNEGVTFSKPAIAHMVNYTQGYPYFVQEYGKAVWNLATKSKVDLAVVVAAQPLVEATLDTDFFALRSGTMTPREIDLVKAMAAMGAGPQSVGGIALAMGLASSSSIGTLAARLIDKGLIYGPERGQLNFTVPHFDRYIARNF